MSASPVRGAGAPPPLGIPLKFSYGLGSVANGVITAALGGSILQLYFNQVLGVPAILVGAAIMVSLIADVILDPLIGTGRTTSVPAGGGATRSCTPPPCRRRCSSI